MVHAIASTLMSACLLAHAMLGCCWHHGHECAAQEAVAQADVCCEHHCCPADHESPAEGSQPCDCRIECGNSCVYLPLEKTIVDGSAIAFDFVAINNVIKNSQCSKSIILNVAGGFADLAPPLPLHLLHQILVI